ncbi:predicted protein [Nematostella vectensis]|uniref:GP-PDE domain-containing protein n=2 Tax=Nematostella vectensis TaxID=45351 RepID=A7RKN1_NEMVE|nr:predicted protein [Nematostella vectensis]|eukprot:XP_001640078.1 predicted protein [Nematostella vectensis]
MALSAVTNGLHIYLVLFLLFLAGFVFILYRLLRFPKPGPYVVKSFIRRNASNRDSPVLIAHRGAGLEAPENTLAAFRNAKKNGAHGVEFDLDFTRDGVPVIIHDSSVDRTTDGVGNVSDMDFEQLRLLNASARHSTREQFPNECIPSLEETISTCINLGLQMYIDVKKFTEANKVANCLKDVFARYELYDKAMVCSFYPNVIFEVRRADPNILTALTWRKHVIANRMDGVPRHKPLWLQLITPVLDRIWELHLHSWVFDFLGVSVFLCNKDHVSKFYVEEWRERGVSLVLWTVNNPVEQKFFSQSLKLPIMTDYLCSETPYEEQSV